MARPQPDSLKPPDPKVAKFVGVIELDGDVWVFDDVNDAMLLKDNLEARGYEDVCFYEEQILRGNVAAEAIADYAPEEEDEE